MEVWEQALNESLSTIEVSAKPLDIETGALDKLRKDHFADGFKDAYAATPGDWAKNRDKVLRMSKCAGALAGLLAEWKTEDPVKIKIVHLLAAMAVVKPGCAKLPKGKAKGGFEPRGKPCQRTRITKAAKTLLLKRMDEFDVKPE